MQALRTPLERLVRELRWFGTATELRALYVHTTPTQRMSVLEHVAAEEHVPGNRSPFVVLEAPITRASSGWSERADELVLEHASIREACANATPPIAVPPLDRVDRETPFLTFAATLAAFVEGLRSPLEGLVLVLSPVAVEVAASFTTELDELMRAPALGAVRWVVVDTTPDAALCQVSTLPVDLRLVADARVDPNEAREEMAARLAQMKSAPAGATSAQLVGGAGPRVAPPPRRGAAVAAPIDPAFRELGLATLEQPDALRDLQIALLEAAAATSTGDLDAAIRAFTRAVDFTEARGLIRERLLVELMRAGLLAQGRAFERAVDELSRVREAALELQATDLAVQAQLSLAACWLARSDHAMAAAAYAEAGRLGSASGQTVLAIEGYRAAGQLLADDRKLEEAGRCFRLALEAADAGEPADRALSTAHEAARALAALCRKHGLVSQAQALETQAERLEAEAEAFRKGLN